MLISLFLPGAVTDLLLATPEEDILRRDIYDRPPIFKWVDGRVVLLGDSAHAMQPNLGQGGGMAIEDAFQLSTDLVKEAEESAAAGREFAVEDVLKSYFNKRVLRAGAIHGMAGMAAFMASTYKAYLGEGLGPLEWITKFKVPHPGRVGGQLVMKLTMPAVLEWVLGGYKGALDRSGARPNACRLGDQPKGFDESDFPLFMRDNDALLRASNAEWLLQPAWAAVRAYQTLGDPLALTVPIGEHGISVGSGEGCSVTVESPVVAAKHAHLERVGEDYFVTDLGSVHGTWRNGLQVAAGQRVRVLPGDELCFGTLPLEDDPAGEKAAHVFRIKLRHMSLGGSHGQYDRTRSAQAASDEREMALASGI